MLSWALGSSLFTQVTTLPALTVIVSGANWLPAIAITIVDWARAAGAGLVAAARSSASAAGAAIAATRRIGRCGMAGTSHTADLPYIRPGRPIGFPAATARSPTAAGRLTSSLVPQNDSGRPAIGYGGRSR